MCPFNEVFKNASAAIQRHCIDKFNTLTGCLASFIDCIMPQNVANIAINHARVEVTKEAAASRHSRAS